MQHKHTIHMRKCILHLFIYMYIDIYIVVSVHKHLWATVWTEMMSKLQASKWFINKQNQSTEATVNLPSPLSILLSLSTLRPIDDHCGGGVGGLGAGCRVWVSTTFNQNPNNRNFWPMQEAFPSLYTLYPCVCVCVCGCILEISSFRQHFRQLNHVRNEKWTCPPRMWPEQCSVVGVTLWAIILTTTPGRQAQVKSIIWHKNEKQMTRVSHTHKHTQRDGIWYMVWPGGLRLLAGDMPTITNWF